MLSLQRGGNQNPVFWPLGPPYPNTGSLRLKFSLRVAASRSDWFKFCACGRSLESFSRVRTATAGRESDKVEPCEILTMADVHFMHLAGKEIGGASFSGAGGAMNRLLVYFVVFLWRDFVCWMVTSLSLCR